MRRLRYRDSYGRWREGSPRPCRPGMPAKWTVIMLTVFAGLAVIASMIH